MRGVFRTGDRLTVQPCSIQELAPGDIIVFAYEGQDIVHRIVEHQGDRLITCGDSNPALDPQAVLPEQIRGIVSLRCRHQTISPVRNGVAGLRQWRRNQRLWQTFFAINRLLNRIFAPGSLSWIYRISPTLLRLESQSEYKIVHCGRTIGRFDPTSGSYHFRKPWSLFVSRRFVRERLRVSNSNDKNNEPPT